MSYKNGAKYIKLRSLYEGYVDEDIIVAAANESVSDITKYHIIVTVRLVEKREVVFYKHFFVADVAACSPQSW